MCANVSLKRQQWTGISQESGEGAEGLEELELPVLMDYQWRENVEDVENLSNGRRKIKGMDKTHHKSHLKWKRIKNFKLNQRMRIQKNF
jgi:hypothetical protein